MMIERLLWRIMIEGVRLPDPKAGRYEPLRQHQIHQTTHSLQAVYDSDVFTSLLRSSIAVLSLSILDIVTTTRE